MAKAFLCCILILYLVFYLLFVFRSDTAAAEKMGAVWWESMSSLSSRAGLEKGQKSPRKPFHAVAQSCLGSRVSLSLGVQGRWVDLDNDEDKYKDKDNYKQIQRTPASLSVFGEVGGSTGRMQLPTVEFKQWNPIRRSQTSSSFINYRVPSL